MQPDNMDAYARSVGFRDNAERMQEIRRYKAMVEANMEKQRQRRRHAAPIPTHAATAAGVTAREYDPEALRAGRIDLGLEAAEAAE